MTLINLSVKETVITEIKDEANRRILAVLPEWKQRNLTAQSVKLINAGRTRSLTAEEENQLSDIENVWDTLVKPIRDYSDELENRVNAGEAVDIHVGWP